jgi:glutamate-ammonia-ligase adenylyltransferase
VEAALRQPRDPKTAARDVLDMRALMERERPPSGFWDLKLSPGGLVDIEFAAQFLQIVHAAGGGPLRANTAQALAALDAQGLAPRPKLARLQAAWTQQQDVSQLLKAALTDGADPSVEPVAFRRLLARAGGARDFNALETSLASRRAQARKAFRSILRA